MKVRSLARRLRLSHYVERRPGRVLYAFDADGEPIWMAYDASWPRRLLRGAPSSVKGRRRAGLSFWARS